LKGIATKERAAFQLSQAVKKRRVTKMKLSEIMDISRTHASSISHPAM
jgi:hypothetical protein